MKIAFISDIHGNAVALDAVLQDLTGRNVDKVCVLGDLCFRGPEPERALNLIQSLNCDVIKGNADEWVVRGIRKGEVPEQALEMMAKEREWTLSQLGDGSLEYLRNLPTELSLDAENIKIHAFHATPNSLFDVVQPFESDDELNKRLMTNEADIYIYAHIHKPFIRYTDGKCVINLGSVGLPFDGVNKSSYAIIDVNKNGFQTSIIRVGFDVEKVINQLKELNYPNTELIASFLRRAKM